jgi:D-alanyl-D-alanine carboxypeptidase/D-alanyl-D-alanine-endopeptidase (penicillin-binding protein 4)
VHLSPPLAEIAAVTNHVSHNLFAEALLKAVGRVAVGEGSFTGGARAVEYFLGCETELDSANVRLVDGSGLSRFNQVTARATIRLLDYMTRSGTWEVYVESLPEAGTARGLRRMFGTAAAENLRAKTGTIQNVSSLSGYVRSADGERLAFSVIANGVPSTSREKGTEDAIGARLARFRR